MFGMIGKPEQRVAGDAGRGRTQAPHHLPAVAAHLPAADVEAFDGPDGVLSCPRRNESTTAPQSLALLNSSFMMEQAKALAAKVQTVEEAWQRVSVAYAVRQGSRPRRNGFLERQTARLGSKPPR